MEITHFVLQQGACAGCGRVLKAQVPSAHQAGYGPRFTDSDQGSQFTSLEFTGRLEAAGIHISIHGRGRALYNTFVERLWRTVKQEEVYLRDYRTPRKATQELDQ
jgi:putative transposase